MKQRAILPFLALAAPCGLRAQCEALTAAEWARIISQTSPRPMDASARPGCESSRSAVIVNQDRAEPAVSITTLGVPRKARRAFERARKEPNQAKAAQHLERAVAIDPRFAEAWNLLGTIRLELGQPEPARQAFERALAADPKLTEARLYHAVAVYWLGQTTAAKQSLRGIAESGDERMASRARLVLGDLLAYEGDFRSAAGLYREFLKLQAGSTSAERVRRYVAEWQAKGLIE